MFESLQERLGSILNGLTGRGALSEADVSAALREIRRALIEADVALEVVRGFVDRVREKAVGATIVKSIKPGQMVVKIVHDELVAMLGAEGETIDLNAPAPVVVMMVGLQGSGKTTTSGKIAKRLAERQNKKVLLASLDTRRPAAQEQLRQIGEQVKVATLPVIAGQSPVEIARRSVQAGRLGGYDVVILDTAGRSHIDEPLMAEMAEIRKVSNPHEILLVADSLTGQDAVNLAKSFDTRVGITGLVLTRMDGDGRGGAALSMRAVTGKPIKLIGTGEKMDALEEFHPKRIADRILGMGDIVSLVEKAAENIDAEQAAAMAKKMQSGKFDLNDLADQLRQMQKMGGIGGIMGMMPGMGGMKDQMAAAGMDDKTFARQLAIISSMTRAERANPDLLKHSRKQRIAKGSGTDAAGINKLLKQHRQMADMMKAMGGKGKGAGMMQKMMGGMASKMGLGGLAGGMGGMMGGGMSDLSKLDPKQLEALQKQAQASGLGGGLPGLPGGGGLPGLPGGMKLPGLGGGGLPGLPKEVSADMDDANPQAVLKDLRASIDNIDAALIHMLAERFRCTQAVGRLKAAHGLPPADPARERHQIARLRKLADDAALDPDFAEKFLNFIIREVIRHHEMIAAGNIGGNDNAATSGVKEPNDTQRNPGDKKMALKIRLARAGSKKRPYYHIVVADVRSPRDGRFIEQLGSWNPTLPKDANRVTLNEERIKHWMSQGALPTDRVLRFLDQAGIAKRETPNNPKKAEPGKKAQERVALAKKAEDDAAAKKAAEEAAAAEAAAAPAEEAPAEEAAAS